jgi:two-component system, LytTR family, sensor kinase
MKTRIVTILIHVSAWLFFLSLPYVFRPKVMMHPGMEGPGQGSMFLHFLAFNVYLIAIFYLHGYWMLPKLMLKKRWFTYSGILILLFIVFMSLREMLFVRLRPPEFMHSQRFELFRPERLDSIFLFAVIIVISGGIWTVQEWLNAEKKARQIEAQRMAMELSFLRSQINPHFLFNTLNSIYSLALMRSEQTANAVMKLSDIMRYITEDANTDMVLLEKEVNYIRYYVELQKIRLGPTEDIRLEVIGEIPELTIPPLILMPFVENAFKYGIGPEEQTSIHIRIQMSGNYLSFTSVNRVVCSSKHLNTLGLGISNTRQRLEQIYPGKHKLDLMENNKAFIVKLNIQLA